MRSKVTATGFKLWLSTSDTLHWARKPGAAWPGSTIAGNRLFVEYDANGVCELALNGRDAYAVPPHELGAIVADHILAKLPDAHPCRYILAQHAGPAER